MPIAAVIKGQTYAIHSDHLNTPRKLTQADGQAAWQWEYSAFGDEQPTTAAKRFTSETTTPTTGATSVPEVTFNLRYPGQYFDAETKLHYNYFRSYDSRTGRYTQGDPIGLDGGWNRFGYVGGDPLGFIDVFGLQKTADEMLGPDTKDGPRPLDYPITPKRPFIPPPRPPQPPSDPDPWPGPDDAKGQCIRLSVQCRQQRWTGNCNACEMKCIAQGEWPFRGPASCRPRKNQNQCAAPGFE
nr:RHS repeat-associated core domain-containing protein [Acidovorax sp. sic0104]